MIVRETVSFSVKLLAILLVAFCIHFFINSLYGIEWTENLFVPAYIFNYLIVVLLYFVITFFKERKSQNLGFMYLGGFFIKIILFMIFFSPVYNADGEASTIEFATFFTPYAICLFFETFVLVRVLNKA